tara:strand:+ start:199 stop:540 length:342 start_codon:yes stop_codon:yes gene_type:complete
MSSNDKKATLNSKKSWNKKDLTNILSTQLKIPKSKASEYLNAFVDILSEGLIDGKKITISDFGTFSVSQRSGFKGTHPQTGEPLDVTARFIPVFKVGKKLKEALNPHLDGENE